MDKKHLAKNLTSAALLNNQGNDFFQHNEYVKALECYDAALTYDTNNPKIWFNKANVFDAQGLYENALVAYKYALSLSDKPSDIYNNMGLTLQCLGRFDEAEQSYQSAIKTANEYTSAYGNYGVLLKELRRFDEAKQMYETALRLKPNDFETVWNLALLYLSHGNFRDGWLLYESRYSRYKQNKIVEKPNISLPQWRGEDAFGKTILVLPEQGFGDEIQFIRFVKELKRRGAHVVVQCRRELKEFFTSCDDIDLLIIDGNDAVGVKCDFWVFTMSLPLLLQRDADTFSQDVPYLHARSEKCSSWAHVINSPLFRVGLVWKGESRHANDMNRSIHSFEQLRALWNIQGAAFYSLQKGRDEAIKTDLPLTQIGSRIKDFSDTAAIIAQLDLVICVDTAIAHVAGAIGKTCFVLIPHIGADWRWGIDAEHSPWYPSLNLFRQGQNESWEAVIERVALALTEKVGARDFG